MESYTKSITLITKLGTVINILQFYGFYEHGRWMMLRLSKKTATYWNEINSIVRRHQKVYSDDRLILNIEDITQAELDYILYNQLGLTYRLSGMVSDPESYKFLNSLLIESHINDSPISGSNICFS